MSGPTETHRVARSVAAFRACRHDAGIAYRATLEATGPQAVNAVLAGMTRGGLIEAVHEEGDFAVLDIIDATGSPIDDRAIRTEAAFDRLREILHLRVTCSDCSQCDRVRRHPRRMSA
jgi:hypothetical protein